MPNRVLRDWTNSERFDELSAEAEIFFTRLIMKADDFGGFYGNTKLLKSHLYPLKDLAHKKIEPWILECVKIGIITYYKVEGINYIRINDFGQRTRIMKSKFPECPSNDCQMTDTCPTDDGLKPNQTETKPKEKPNRKQREEQFLIFWDKYPRKVDKKTCKAKFMKLSDDNINKILSTMDKFLSYKPFETYTHPNPETYLNRERWNDEIPEPKAKEMDHRTAYILSQLPEDKRQEILNKNK